MDLANFGIACGHCNTLFVLAVAHICRMKLFCRARIIGNMDQQLFARTGA